MGVLRARCRAAAGPVMLAVQRVMRMMRGLQGESAAGDVVGEGVAGVGAGGGAVGGICGAAGDGMGSGDAGVVDGKGDVPLVLSVRRVLQVAMVVPVVMVLWCCRSCGLLGSCIGWWRAWCVLPLV